MMKGSLSDSENMMEALQTRHTQRMEEYEEDDVLPKMVEIPSEFPESSPKNSVDEGNNTGTQSRSQSLTSSPQNLSIRERVRNRAKSGGLDKSLQPRKLRGLRERLLPTRFEESANISPVTEELDPTLQKSIATTKHWKRMKLKKNRDAGIISEEDAFQFFVGSIDNPEAEAKVAEVSPVSDETMVELHGIEESPFYPERVKPVYLSQKDRLLFEGNMYFYPSSIPALPEVKVPHGMPFRNLEDEGLYVGKTPRVGLGNLSRMENRIISAGANSNEWFDVDGHLKRLADPLKERPVHNMFTDDLEIDPLLQVDWAKAELSSLDARYIDEHGYHHYQLDVDVSMIRFVHQPLFSKEHFVEYKVAELYENYLLREKTGLIVHLTNRIHALHIALQHIKQEQGGAEDSEITKNHQTSRVRDIHHQMRELRMNCENEEIKERSLLLNILRTWKSLKKLRESQGFINTATTLKVRKELTNRIADEEEIEGELEQELENERFLFKENYSNEFSVYESKMHKWKKYQRLLRKRQAKEVAGEVNDGEELLEVPKPEPPLAFDEQQVRINIRERMMKFKRKPGEPILLVELQNGAVITPTEKCPRGEQLRRADLKNVRYMVKIVFNDMEVARTSVRGMSTDFLVQFAEILNVRILQWPESIKLQIYDANTMKTIAELYAPIPEPAVLSTQENISLTELEFSCDQIVQYNRHDAIGSGVPIRLDLEVDGEKSSVIPLTSGVLYASVSWGVDENGTSLAPPVSSTSAVNANKHFDALAALGAEGMVDLQKLLSWISQAKLDPNDPTNADIITLAKMAQLSHYNNAGGPQFFRLNNFDEDMEFITKEEMEANKRFKLIRLRSSGVFEFKHYQNIPIDEKFISEDVFEEYERKQSIALPDPEKIHHKEAVSLFLEQVRQKVHSRYEMAKRRVDLEDIVTEEAIPDLGSLGARIAQIMEPRRPLRPTRKERKKIGGQGLTSVKEVNILINVIRAFNLPLREFESLPRPIDQSLAASLSTNVHVNSNRSAHTQTVYPFVEVVFQGNSLTTSVAEGSFPNWNEDLILPFKAPNNDYTSEALQLIKDSIFISLFDEVLVDALKDERLRETTIHRRIERRYLGRIEIPFSTVYFNSKVEGFIPLNTPQVLLGYQPSSDKLAGFNMVKEEPLVQLFVTIDPQLQPAPPMPEIFESSEDDILVQKSQVWLSVIRAKFPKRMYKLMVSDLDGKKVFVTRYLHPQKPPDELLVDTDVPDMQKMKLLARFVSLVPYVSDSVQFPDLCDIWTTSEQFLRMLAGDEEEHAVLLCNYFLWLGKKVYLILGYGIPEGSTAYVLTEEGISFRLWNPSTGDNYEIENVHCPLRSVGCIVSPDNVYGNIQQDDHPSKISFRFSVTKAWKPFFTRAYPNPGLASLQEESLPYIPIDHQHAINVQDELERVIRDKLMEWRPSSITKFNRGCNQAFKTLLENIESKMVLSGISAVEHRSYVDHFASSHHLTGYTIQMPYTNHKAVIDGVFCTGIHNIEDSSVEFAIATHVHPYPNSVEAVWVYIGSLVRRGK